MIGAGQMKARLIFQTRASSSDSYGNHEGSWVDQFTVAARVQPLRGGEEVIASRLSGVQPVLIIVRRSTDTRQILAAWRAVDANTGEVYALRSPATDMDEKGAFLTIVASAGVPA